MKNDRMKNDRIKSDRMKNDRIKSDRIKTDRIKSITDPKFLRNFDFIESKKMTFVETICKTQYNRCFFLLLSKVGT
jgi:hypothetical protein